MTKQNQERQLLAGGERTLNRTGYMTAKRWTGEFRGDCAKKIRYFS